MIRDKYVYAGQTVRTKPNIGIGLQGDELGGREFIIEDYCENVLGVSWMNANGNPAALEYAMRNGFNGNFRLDNEVVYGKIDGLGHLIHVSELDLVTEDNCATCPNHDNCKGTVEAYWIHRRTWSKYVCSNCSHESNDFQSTCPNCKAKMIRVGKP